MSAMMHALPATPEEVEEYRPGSVLGPIDRDDYAIHKHRKTASTGGGRAWTEEEESYLLRTRNNKMPYKHIAAHLHKTELACRLHYHQMSYGSNRRRRTGSVSSTCSSIGSFNPLSSLRESTPEHNTTPYTHLSPVASPPSSPESINSRLAPFGTADSTSTMPQRPILPKPIMSSNSIASITSTRPLLPSPADLNNKPLRLDTSFSSPDSHHHYNSANLPQAKPSTQSPQQIDSSRLLSLYSAHRSSFWSHIATQYSTNSTPSPSATQLEDAFFATYTSQSVVRGSSPPTPGPSPSMGSGSGFSAVNSAKSEGRDSSAVNVPSPVERCAVSGLLN